MKKFVLLILDLIKNEVIQSRVRKNSNITIEQYRFPVMGTQIRKEHHEY